MTLFACPYFQTEVELTEERQQHIAQSHPDLLPEHWDRFATTLAAPDQVRGSARFSSARLFTRWYADLRGGKYVVVVVVTETAPVARHWILTAYIARRLAEGDIEWQRS